MSDRPFYVDIDGKAYRPIEIDAAVESDLDDTQEIQGIDPSAFDVEPEPPERTGPDFEL